MVSGIEKLVLFPEALLFAIKELPLKVELIFIFSMLFVITAILDLIIFPVIFNFYLIPKIEKKLGIRLIFNPILNGHTPFCWFMSKKSQVSTYIANRYIAWKLHKDSGLPLGFNGFALKYAGYTIKMASKSEIFLSCWTRLNLSICLIAIAMLIILTSLLNIR